MVSPFLILFFLITHSSQPSILHKIGVGNILWRRQYFHICLEKWDKVYLQNLLKKRQAFLLALFLCLLSKSKLPSLKEKNSPSIYPKSFFINWDTPMGYFASTFSWKGLFPWGSFSVVASSEGNQRRCWSVHSWSLHHLVI